MSAASSTAGAFPERVGKYELLLPLGTGGTATVYLARTRGVAGFEREVALKLVHAHLRADEESRLHLLEEARNPMALEVWERIEEEASSHLKPKK